MDDNTQAQTDTIFRLTSRTGKMHLYGFNDVWIIDDITLTN